MRILSDLGNRGVWYDAAIQVETVRNWGADPGYYTLSAMNTQHSLACLGHNLAVAGALERAYNWGVDDGKWEAAQ